MGREGLDLTKRTLGNDRVDAVELGRTTIKVFGVSVRTEEEKKVGGVGHNDT